MEVTSKKFNLGWKCLVNFFINDGSDQYRNSLRMELTSNKKVIPPIMEVTSGAFHAG